MKKTFLFCTRLYYYWVLLPLIFLLAVCIDSNSDATNLLKLYPLIVLTVLGMVFILIYFFRAIEISYSEIKYLGLFSSRDSAIINEGKTLILTPIGRGRIKVTLFGNDGVLPDFSWAKSTGDSPRDISLFRGKTIGGKRSCRKIMKFFGVDTCDFNDIFKGGFNKEYDIVSVSSEECPEGTEIRITITKTV